MKKQSSLQTLLRRWFCVPVAIQVFLVSPLLLAQESKEDVEPKSDAQSETAGESRQVARSVDVRLSDGESKKIHYLQFLPTDYTDKKKPTPLIMFLHGRGECGQDLELVKSWGPPKIVEGKPGFPFVVISPQCDPPGWDVVQLKGLLDHAVAELNVDPTRIYVTGLSMGGYGTWKFAASYPDSVAAAIPICGGGHAALAETLVNVPIWAFHGDADQVVPLSASRNLVDAIRDEGGSMVQLKVYEGVGHNSWKETYANPAIYEWLMDHTRELKE